MCISRGAVLVACGGLMVERRKSSVLVVEDDEPLLGLFEKVLEQSGFEAVLATTLERAQTLIAERRFDILVFDLSVAGGRNVFEFTAAVRARWPKMKLLIISGLIPDDIAFRAQAMGIEVLDKPFSPPDLIARIASLLGRQAA
ncbi:MAG: response regulator [Limisphaerales bacterium]